MGQQLGCEILRYQCVGFLYRPDQIAGGYRVDGVADMHKIPLGQDYDRNRPYIYAGIGPKLRAVVTQERESFVQERMRACIGG